MYQHILVAVDGSSTSDLALAEAVRLAREQGAKLRLVHVVDALTLNYDAEWVNYAEIREAFIRAGNDTLKRARATAQQAGVEAETKLAEIEAPGRRIADMIAHEAQSWPADLIVIGTHGRRGISHVLLGSVAESVLRIAGKPVLLIRGQ